MRRYRTNPWYRPELRRSVALWQFLGLGDGRASRKPLRSVRCPIDMFGIRFPDLETTASVAGVTGQRGNPASLRDCVVSTAFAP